MPVKTVLIVDDEALIRKTTGILMRQHGYTVLEAASGTAALTVISESHPDLVILDIMMPGMNGWEVLAHLKKNPDTAAIPVIICTAGVVGISVEIAQEQGALTLVQKPFDIRQILDAVETM